MMMHPLTRGTGQIFVVFGAERVRTEERCVNGGGRGGFFFFLRWNGVNEGQAGEVQVEYRT